MKHLLLSLLFVAAPVQAQSFLAPPHPLFGETGHVRVSENTGDLTIQYPFHLPPSRGRYAPTLALSYSSGSGSSGVVGLGWRIAENFIESTVRAPPIGVNSSGATIERQQYWLQLGGDRKLLVSVSSNGYRLDVGHGYLAVSLNGGSPSSWTAVDGFSTTYTFTKVGSDSSRWYLTSVVDLDGNKTSFSYAGDDDSTPGHYLLSLIQYNSVGTWFAHQVVLGYSNLAAPVAVEAGQGILALKRKQLATVTIQRQASSNATPLTLYSYTLTYQQSSETGRWLLSGVAQLGRDGSPLGLDSASAPFGVKFSYSPFTAGFSLSNYVELAHPTDTPTAVTCSSGGMSGPCQPQDVAAWLDLDGDGLPDMVWGDTNESGLNGGGLRWARNTSQPGAPSFATVQKLFDSDKWNGGGVPGGAVNSATAGATREPDQLRAPQAFSYGDGLASGVGTTMLVMDFDGDGRPDLLSVQGTECTNDQLEIRFNRPDSTGAPNFTTVACATLPAALINEMRLMSYFGARMLEWVSSPNNLNMTMQYLGLFDINGDGVLDFVSSVGADFHVYRGFRNPDGSFGFAAGTTWTPTTPWTGGPSDRRPLRQTVNMFDCGPTHPRAATAALMDLNGDGLLDYVVTPVNTTESSCYNLATYGPNNLPTYGPWSVSYNTGAGFAARPDRAAWLGGGSEPLISYGRITDRQDIYQQVALNADFTHGGKPDRITAGPARPMTGPVGVACKFSVRTNMGWGFTDVGNAKCIAAPADLVSAPAAHFDLQFQPDWMYDQPAAYCGVSTGASATTCNTTPTFCGCSAKRINGTYAPAGKNGLFLDLDGDGVLDYVVADPYTHAFGWYSGSSTAIRGELVSSILQLGGAKTDVTYASSNTFGHNPDGGSVRYVVTQTVLSGPGLQALTTDHEYSTLRVTAALDDPTRREPLGFSDSWSRDSVTGLVQHTSWGGAHATNGSPMVSETRVNVAPGSPLSSSSATTAFHADSHSYGAQSATSANTCAADATGLTGAQLPVVLFEASNIATRTEHSVSLSSTETIACGDVDVNGHVLRRSITEDASDNTWNGHPGVRVEQSVYGTTNCIDCVAEDWAVDPSGAELFHHWHFYDGYGHPEHVEELAAGVHETSEHHTYNADGTLATTRRDYTAGPYTTAAFQVSNSFTYDLVGLSVVNEVTTDGTTTLLTDTTVEPSTGLPISVIGPYSKSSSATPAAKFYTYDHFNRLAAQSRALGDSTHVVQAMSAFEFVQATTSFQGAITRYSFATPISFTPGQIPSTDDVLMSLEYFDALGRSVQTRKRLGSTSAGDPSAHIARHLGSAVYQVEATVLDGAGRELHRLDPYYSNSSSFYDFWGQASAEATADRAAQRVLSKGYDSLARPVCTVYWPVGSKLVRAPSDPTQCLSSFGENTSYRRATSVTYGADATSFSRPFFTLDTVADWINTTAGAPSTRKYLDAGARTIYERDAYGNFTETKRDVVGRTTAAIRWAGTPGSSSVKVSFINAYDQRGRVVEEDDDSSGTKLYSYLPTGERVLTRHVPLGASPGSSLATFEKQIVGSLGRLVRRVYSKYSPTSSGGACTGVTEQVDDDVQLYYDTPYASGSYGYTAGRLSYQTKGSNPAYWIAYGYTEDGLTSQRDEYVQGISGPHTVARSYRNDGLPTATTVASATLPAPVTYSESYDSAGRPAQVWSGSTVYWDTPLANVSTGAYDAVGHLPTEYADNGALVTVRSFSAFSNQQLTHSITPSTGQPFWDWSGATWAAGKLTGYALKSRNEIASGASYSSSTGTTCSMQYDNDGRLAHTQARPGSAPGPATQNYDEQFSFLMNSSGHSLWNLQSVQSGSVDASGNAVNVVTSNYAYQPGVYDRVVGIARSNTAAPDTFSYDDRGRGLIVGHTSAAPASAERFAYDGPGRLSAIAVNGAVQETDGFDAEGLLVSRTFASGAPDTARYYVDNDMTVVQRGTSSLAYVHIIVGKRRVASLYYSSPSATGWPLYYHRDRLGSVIGTSTAGGIAGVAYRYDIYGKQTVPVGSETDATTSELGYAAALKLSDGLLHLKARTYSPGLRKFLQPDTIDPLRYTYVRGDPVNMIDPNGRWPGFVDDAIAWWKDKMGGAAKDATDKAQTWGTLRPGRLAEQGLEEVTPSGDRSNDSKEAAEKLVDATASGAKTVVATAVLGKVVEVAAAGLEAAAVAATGAAAGEEAAVATEEAAAAKGVSEAATPKYGSTPDGRPLTKHYATDTGPVRNVPGSVVDNTIRTTKGVPVGSGKTVHYDPINNVTVVTGDGGSIVSVRKGPP